MSQMAYLRQKYIKKLLIVTYTNLELKTQLELLMAKLGDIV